MAAFTGFEPRAFQFLKDLSTHNSQWFKAHKPEYQALIVEPSKAFVSALGLELAKSISAAIIAEPKTNGSLAPINNDLRFAPDSPPYKDHLLIKFWEGPAKKTAATLYVRVSGDGIGFATGAVFAEVNAWRKAVASTRGILFASELAKLVSTSKAEVAGQALKRVPSPYPQDHPRAELLRHKMIQVRWQEPLPAVIGKPDFVKWCAKHLQRCAPIHRWLANELA
jgi:uncharacterized protein (TIGR02453 family)